MVKIEDFEAALSRIDAATDGIAAELKALKDAIISDGGLKASVEEDVLARLDAAATKLESVGKEVPGEPGTPPIS